MTDKAIPHDWRAVGMDFTPHYNIREEDKLFVKRIVEVFFYDRNEHTHLCELTPSYFLRYLYTFIVFADNAPEGMLDSLDQRYCCGTDHDDTYMHVSDVDRMTEFATTYGEGSAEASEEDAREHWQGNYPF